MTDKAGANRFEAALDGILKVFPAKDLVDQLEGLCCEAKHVFEICSRELDFLKVGIQLNPVIDQYLKEYCSNLQLIHSSSALHTFCIEARGLKSEWLHYPGGKTLLVHSAAIHVAETLLQFPDVMPNVDVNWSVATLNEPDWLLAELEREYRAARYSLLNRKSSNIPRRRGGGRDVWRFADDTQKKPTWSSSEEREARRLIDNGIVPTASGGTKLQEQLGIERKRALELYRYITKKVKRGYSRE